MVPKQVIENEPCNCEYFEHFTGEGDTEGTSPNRIKHVYRGVPSGKHRAQHVGPICDKCAETCMKDFLIGVTLVEEH
jgi:hypothetical protein